METSLPSRKFVSDDLFRFEFIMEAQLSPDAEHAVYVVMRCNEEKDKEYSNLWMVSLVNGESFQLTYGDWSDYAPVWSPDGKKIAFLSSREGKAQLYCIHLQG